MSVIASLDLPFIWAGLIAFAVFAYVVLDGFDLGIGMLFPFLHSESDRDTAMNSVAPVWDGNETWLVLGGGGLFAAFPLAYAVVMPALYMPILLMLTGLIFRGVAFEFRWKTRRWKRLWDHAFAFGSTLASLCQGIALGALVQGIHVENRAYGGGMVGLADAVQPRHRPCPDGGLYVARLDMAHHENSRRCAGHGLQIRLVRSHRDPGRHSGGKSGDAIPSTDLFFAVVQFSANLLAFASPDCGCLARLVAVRQPAKGARNRAIPRLAWIVRIVVRRSGNQFLSAHCAA